MIDVATVFSHLVQHCEGQRVWTSEASHVDMIVNEGANESLGRPDCAGSLLPNRLAAR